MNEVRPTQLSLPVVTRASSSTGTENVDSLALSGKELPVKEVDTKNIQLNNLNSASAKEEKPLTEQAVAAKIDKAVSEINEYVQSVQRDLHFSVDEESGVTVIRVRDKESGELIRQIPEDIFLNLAQNLKDNQTLHLLDAHG